MSKGTAEFRHKDQLWVLKFDFQALLAYEKKSKGDSIMALMLRVSEAAKGDQIPLEMFSLTVLSNLLSAGLRKMHPKVAKDTEALLCGWLNESDEPTALQSELVTACISACTDALGMSAPSEEEPQQSPED